MKKALVCIRSKKVRMNTHDVPWITQHLKDLIRKREQAFHKKGAESIQYKLYRNQVKRERKPRKAPPLPPPPQKKPKPGEER